MVSLLFQAPNRYSATILPIAIGNCKRNTRDRLLIDDSTLRQDADFLLSIRSYFLTLRYDDDHVVEPYSPHSRAFSTIPMVPVLDKYSSGNETSYSSLGPSPTPPLVSSSRKRKADNDIDNNSDLSDKARGNHLPSKKRRVKKRPLASPPMRGPYFRTFLVRMKQRLEKNKSYNDQDEDDFDFVKELEIMGNAFASDNPNAKEQEHTSASIDPNILVAASDPVAMYAVATIVARGFEVLKEHRCQKPVGHVGNYVEHARTFHASDPSDKVESSLPSHEEQFLSLESRSGDAKEIKLLEQESELSSALATSKDSLDKHDVAVTELTMSHSFVEKEIATAKEAMTKRKKAEENFQSARTALESLHWEPRPA
ncbi:5-amino-6-(5-phospho-D-ribitylamino)uracil phosphatase YwtE, partial [Bienertia sinuspersici]